MTAAIDNLEVVDAWDTGPVLEVATPATGTINRTLLLKTASGDYALRVYRHRDRAPVEREHALIAHARAGGLPAVGPIALPGGGTILERGGRFYALFPRAAGRQLARDELGAGEVAAMGVCLAGIHTALRSFPNERVAQRSFAIDRAAALAGIAGIESAIRARARLDESDRRALARLASQRAWIERSAAIAPHDIARFEQQAIHGDYQHTNLFFEPGRVSAIIDWDQSYAAPRAWEVVRTLHLVFDFEPGPSRVFLDAYRARAPLSLEEIDSVATYYAIFRAHDLWVYQAVYLEGNERVRGFIGGDDFVSLTGPWNALKKILT